MAANPVRRTPGIETEDIQGLVLQGYGRLRAAAFLVLELGDVVRARAWLQGLVTDLTLGDSRPAGEALNVAFTPRGLERLGLPGSVIAGFSPEFLEGMTSGHRSRLLGDQGDSSPSRWSWGGPGCPAADALLLVYAEHDDRLADRLRRLRAGLAEAGVRETASLDTQDIGTGEHFGFRDGLSQPVLAGSGRPSAAMHEIQPGEFLLGYPNEHGQLPRSPGDVGRNGSYLVLRTLSQDVGGFWRYADRTSRGADGSADAAARLALASRMVGRWPSGAPLTRTPQRDDPSLAEDNDFGYAATDEHGYGCPIGAHVRRTNPRDSLPPKPGTTTSVDVGKRHRLLRRGRPYGPGIGVDEAVAQGPDDEDVRGLHFVALCADLARQFEFVSHTWVQNPNFAGLLADVDPLLGGTGERGTSFTIQREPVRARVHQVPSFVRVRGGAYFFLPGATALRHLCGA